MECARREIEINLGEISESLRNISPRQRHNGRVAQDKEPRTEEAKR